MKTTLQPPKTIELKMNFTNQRRTANIFGVFELQIRTKGNKQTKQNLFGFSYSKLAIVIGQRCPIFRWDDDNSICWWSLCLTIRLHVQSSCANAIARTIFGSYWSCGCTISLTSEGLNSYLKSRTSKNQNCNQDIADEWWKLYWKGGIPNSGLDLGVGLKSSTRSCSNG